MSCHAPNDKLIDGLTNAIEVYYCELEFGHLGPHKCSGHPIWWDAVTLSSLLPADADELADELAQDADKLEATYESSYGPVPLVSKLRRAAAILRGEA